MDAQHNWLSEFESGDSSLDTEAVFGVEQTQHIQDPKEIDRRDREDFYDIQAENIIE